MKGCHSWSKHAKYKVSISYGSKVIAKVNIDNRQTDKQTDRQDKNIIRSGGIKIFVPEKRNTHAKYLSPYLLH